MRQIAMVFVLLFSTDGFADGPSPIRTFSLRHADAASIAVVLNEQFDGAVKFSANSMTNTIYGRLMKEYEEEVNDFIQNLEDDALNAKERKRIERQREEERRELEKREFETKRSTMNYLVKHVGASDLHNILVDLQLSQDVS